MYNKKLLDNIKQYLEDNEILYGNTYALNSTGKESTFSEYIQAMIYSLLSARTSWNKIEKKFVEIDELFFNYNKDEILAHEYAYFYNGLTTLKLRSQVTAKQMASLHKNIMTLVAIEKDFGSLDNFAKSRKPIYIAHMLANDLQYKIDMMGLPLACEMLRNVGFDLIKPDEHIRRIFGKGRLGFSTRPQASEIEAYEIAEIISADTNYPLTVIDSLLWNYCARGYGEVCGAIPKCSICVIKEWCNNSREHIAQLEV